MGDIADMLIEQGFDNWINGEEYEDEYDNCPRRYHYPYKEKLRPRRRDSQHTQLVEKLLASLNQLNIKAHVITVAASGSCYIGFSDSRMGKCRVGDHEERDRYGYRWQIRTDIEEAFEDTSKGHRQFFFPADKLEDAVNRMKRYYSTIQARDK